MTNIEQADMITGCSSAFKPHGLLGYAEANEKDTYRRGAYIEWLTDEKNESHRRLQSTGTLPELKDSSLAHNTIEDLAAAVIGSAKRSKPKGDGLPERMHVYWNESGINRCAYVSALGLADLVRPMTPEEQRATVQYLRLCLSAPVRRFLAAFDVVEPTSDQKLSGEAFVVSTHTAACLQGHKGPVCWLVPKEIK